MAKTKISEFSATPGNNTDIDGINIAEGCAPSGINDAIRELMAQLKDFQTGAAGDSFGGPVSGNTGSFTTLSSTGNTTLGDAAGDAVTVNGTATFANANPTLSAGTANGVAYLNGSKVLTTGSALTFDGTAFRNLPGAVASGGTANGKFRLDRSDGATNLGYIDWITAGDGLRFYNNNGGYFSWEQSSAGEMMRLTSTGLGIGTSSPSYKLDVAGDIALKNNATYYWGKTSGGSTTRMLGINSGNTLYIGSIDAAVSSIFFNNGGTTQATLDTSGNLGLGVTPSAGGSIYYKSFELGKAGCGLFAATASLTGSELTYVTGNAVLTYSGGPLWLYGNNGNAATYAIEDGNHLWRIAGSGTAGNAISFTQAMTLTAAGRLGIGTTSPGYTLDVAGVGFFQGIEIGRNGDSIRRNGDMYVGTDGASSNLIFFTNSGVERARIDSSGNLLVGQTTTGLQAGRSFSWQGVGDGSFYVSHSTANAGGDPYIRFGYNGSQIGSITQNGTTGVLYNLTSDYRLKNNPTALTGAKEFVMALQPKTWDWWDGSGKGVGFIAHEFMEVAKYSGNGEKDAVDADGNPLYQSIQPSSSEVVANLVALLQEQQIAIDQLKAELASLKGAA